MILRLWTINLLLAGPMNLHILVRLVGYRSPPCEDPVVNPGLREGI